MEIMDVAPDFCLPDLEGVRHCLREMRGKPVLITFWSAECPQSARVDEVLSACEERLHSEVVFVRIASNKNETWEQLNTVAKERGVSLVLQDAKQEVADLYAAQTTPHCYLVDAEGLLRYQGAFDDVTFRQRTARQQYATAALEAILAGQEPQPTQTTPYGCSIVRHLPDSC